MRAFGRCRFAFFLAAGAMFCNQALAQPTSFHNAGSFAAPASPPQTNEYEDDGSFWQFVDPPVTVSVQWIRFTLNAPIEGDLYIDIDARLYTPGLPGTYALYDSAGNFIAADDSSGGFPLNGAPGLSFGSSAERVQFISQSLRGQHGAQLPAGTYWLAMIAGSLQDVTLGATGWNVSTTQSWELGFGEEQMFLETAIVVGNTTWPEAPSNDDCANALAVSENVGETPAWTGSNIGATQDGFSPCYPNLFSVTTKDIWFSYTPSVSGWAEVVATGGAGGAALPLLTLYDGGCGGPVVRCAGGGSFLAVGGTRLAFPVTAGQPVLLGLAVRAGQWGPMALNIRAFEQGCSLTIPQGAVPEIEAQCGEQFNDGCGTSPALFDRIQVGQTVIGTIFSQGTFRDRDWYAFTAVEPLSIAFTFASQMPAEVAIFRRSASGCPTTSPAFRRTLGIADGCTPITGTAELAAGNYLLAITPLYTDGMNCDSGFNAYWITLDSPNCPRPWFSTQPQSIQACPGEAAVFTPVLAGVAATSFQWQWSTSDAPGALWNALVDGPFTAAGSSAVISGATSPELTVSGVDAAAQVYFRLSVAACGAARSDAASLILAPDGSPECSVPCIADFNGDDGIDDLDITAFFAAFEQGEPGADVNGDDGIDDLDITAFFAAFEAGC